MPSFVYGLAYQPYSAGTTDPIGYVMAYIPVALALVAMVIAFAPAMIMLLQWLRERRMRHERGNTLEAHPSAA